MKSWVYGFMQLQFQFINLTCQNLILLVRQLADMTKATKVQVNISCVPFEATIYEGERRFWEAKGSVELV